LINVYAGVVNIDMPQLGRRQFMKNKLCMLFAIVLLLVGGCNEKSQNYFAGTILKITDNYFVVSPDDSESIRETGDMILVPKEVVSANGVPELAVGERIQVVYNEMELTDEGVIIDIVYAIYKENDLEGTQEK
jgi:hypothetical protein